VLSYVIWMSSVYVVSARDCPTYIYMWRRHLCVRITISSPLHFTTRPAILRPNDAWRRSRWTGLNQVRWRCGGTAFGYTLALHCCRWDTGRGQGPVIIRDLLADDRCSQTVLEFLSTVVVGALVPAERQQGEERHPHLASGRSSPTRGISR
jgi:hypothetical protein